MLKIKEPIRKNYNCSLIGQGYDTIVETFSMYIFESTWKRLEEAKKYAQEKNNGNNQAYTVLFGGMEFQIKPHGGKGKTFLLSNDRYSIDIADAKTDFNVLVKYHACVLWQYGVAEARRIIHEALLKEMNPRPQEAKKGLEGWQRISKADYAFDFYSPDFSKEVGFAMADRLVAHSSCKIMHHFKGPRGTADNRDDGYVAGTSRSVQTITIGKKERTQIQLYDKIAEIKERSGKYWMYKVWEQEGYQPPDDKKGKDVWRLEVRFGRELFNEQGVNTFDDLEKYLGAMLEKALTSRRLVDPSGEDSNRRRWPTHPLWYQSAWVSCYRLKDMIPIGKQEEFKTYEAMKRKDEQDFKALIRRISVRECGDYDWMTAHNTVMQMLHDVEDDEKHEEQIERYQEKQKYIGCAR